jgi:serine/threonine-protein kinase
MDNLPNIQSGDRLGPYEIGAELGRGGIAIVREARNVNDPTQAALAIKIAHRTNAQRDRRFIREFERLRVITLPGVARVYDAGTSDDLIWFVMDQIPGIPIHRAFHGLQSTEQRIQMALEAGARVFDVLAGIHRLGFIHRDIKPSNILVDSNNQTHILDFGLVRLQERGDTVTRAGRLVGTVAFMSPEQTTGLPLTTGTDIFSAGLVLYEGLMGPRPRPQKQEEWLGRMCLQQITSMAIRDPQIPRSLSTVVDRLLSLDPHARPTATEAAKMLRAVSAGTLRADWPNPPRFVGRTEEIERCFSAFEPNEKRLMVLEGKVGTGRRRLLEQVQRRALLYGTPRVTGVCRPQVPGGAVLQILSEIFETHADPEWRVKTAGTDVAALLSMWPSLPLPTPPNSMERPTLNEVAKAAAHTIQRSVDSSGLMVVFERLDAIDSLSARVLQMLLSNAPDRLAVMAITEPRWASPRATRLIDHLVFTDRACRIELPPLSSAQASEVASSLNEDGTMDPIDSCTPQMARDLGLDQLAAVRGETRAQFPSQLAVLGLAAFPLPVEVLRLLNIDPLPWVDDGVLTERDGGFVFKDGWLRQRAQSLISNRSQAEDALADALARTNVNEQRCGHVARHMMHGRDPNRSLPYAIRAAVYAAEQRRFTEARDWLMAIDPMTRKRGDQTYKALRFKLAWARARTSMNTDLSVNREDLIDQAEERALTPEDKQLVAILRADLGMRNGRIAEEVPRLIEQAKLLDPTGKAWLHLKAARMLLDHGDPQAARAFVQETAVLGAHPDRAAVGIDLARLEGRASTVIEGCSQALDRSTLPDNDPFHGILQCRLGWGLLAIGDREGATQAAHLAVHLLTIHGNRARLAEAHHLAALLALGRGHPRAARVMLDPLITAARAFSFLHVEVLGSALKLRVAAAMNDKAAARSALASISGEVQKTSADWRLALARWHRVQRKLKEATAAATWPRPKTPAEVFLSIEAARLRLVTGDIDGASDHINGALSTSEKNGYAELHVLATLVGGAVNPSQDGRWETALSKAGSSPWVELSLTSLAMQGRRAMGEGDAESARTHFQALLDRANHLDHRYHQVVANEALVSL